MTKDPSKGYCCRKGTEYAINGCDGKVGGRKNHACVEKPEEQTTTTEPPEEQETTTEPPEEQTTTTEPGPSTVTDKPVQCNKEICKGKCPMGKTENGFITYTFQLVS